jgi:para-aminobenzoate synthetase/4-amino-4-deoxychorismate lyase
VLEERIQREGLWAAGFIAYEAAPAFDKALTARSPGASPLLWFGLYDTPTAISSALLAEHAPPGSIEPLTWDASVKQHDYERAIERIKAYIEAGDTYQINYTFRLRAPFDGDPWPLFLRLLEAQGTPYGAFLNTADWAVCSASPELFLQLEGQELIARPMKGTAPRGLWCADDLTRATRLRVSEKDRAENVMIVDMMRNDLGRIADIGSVRVPRLFDIEQYPTVWQMTSTAGCTTQAGLSDILRALFPAASITGAPKRRAMQIIAELETTPRGLYTGSIGFMGPRRYAQFNVAIRTAWIDKRCQRAEYGVGSGIVWDSTTASEYEECYAKARILTAWQPDFSLLETLLWTPEQGYFLLEEHLTRLKESARFFAYPVDVADLRRRLAEAAVDLPPRSHRVRLRVAENGAATVEVLKLVQPPRVSRLGLAKNPVDASNAFLYHKTTRRTVYQQALRDRPGCDDVLLWNENGEITESCIANVIFEREGEWFTPPVHCGLLAGVYRTFLMRQGKLKERILRVAEVNACTEIRLINSVRREWPVCLLM